MAATSISTPTTYDNEETPASTSSSSSSSSPLSFLHILIYIILTYLYFHSIFLSDGANYIMVPVPLRNQTTTPTTMTTNANVKNAVRLKSYWSHREYLRVPRSLTHLKAVNSLVEYQLQLDKYEKKHNNKDKDNDHDHDNEDANANAHANEGEGEHASESRGGEGEMHTKNKSAKDENGNNNKNGTNSNEKETSKTPYADSLTLWSSIIVPLFMLMCFSLSCRCLLAILIYRRQLHIRQENEFDIAGQRRQRDGRTNLNAVADFWQIFRTIPLRSRTHTHTRNLTTGARRGAFGREDGTRSLLPTINTNENLTPSLGMGQQQGLRLQMLESTTRRLNEVRIANGSQPLSPSSLAFLLSRSTNNEGGFSGEDYNRLWSMEEANGHGNHGNSGNGNNGHGLDEEDIARFPVRLLEADDDLLLPIINHDRLHLHRQVSDDVNIEAYDDDSDDDSIGHHHGNKCSICLEEYKVGDMVRTIPCFHEFHAQCIDQWLQLKDTCPICKHATRSED
eukprot:CAMPEP_0194077754 /NCGR_PEP_ID=MMETSP0149-20130528/4326_1 /TAXON_ID=122233 /ORGANISM="Chaetoceros debilis, Strain MM31A-1" /LENGTH=507 /DNA_ID=CAMNT_0038758869 /DNA_START=188 /DNA_END=1711 /DNA_ORIENTATION=+